MVLVVVPLQWIFDDVTVLDFQFMLVVDDAIVNRALPDHDRRQVPRGALDIDVAGGGGFVIHTIAWKWIGITTNSSDAISGRNLAVHIHSFFAICQ
jgi:hypothetical protein